MERKIGERFLTPEGVELEVKENIDCEGCYGAIDAQICREIICMSDARKDGMSIIVIKVLPSTEKVYNNAKTMNSIAFKKWFEKNFKK